MPDDVVGRAAELAAVERFLDRAAAGPAALSLEGEAGIGKTTLWEAALAAAEARGFRILRSRPARSEQGLTLGGLSDLFGDLQAAVLEALPAPQRHALEVALLRVQPAGMPPDQRALSVAAAAALRLLATPAEPVLLAVDDLQWLDDSSAAILAYAVRRQADRPVGLLASVRTTWPHPGALDLLATTPPELTERLALGPLSLAALHQLFEVRLGRSFPRLVLVRIEAACGGNPLYALEIGRALLRSETRLLPGDRLPIPDTLGSLMTGRLTALPPRTRRALVMAAAAAEPTPATLERAEPGTVDALAPATADGVVALEEGIVRFGHPLLAQAALGLAGRAELRVAHAALARASVSADARARHLGQAAEGPDARVAATLEDAAAAARDRGATLDAAALYQEASRLTPAEHADERLARAVRAAECLFIDLSEIVQSDGILEAALAEAPPGPARADGLSLRALVQYYHGRVPQAVALGRQAVDEAGDEPVRRATVLGRAAFLRMQLDLEGGVAMINEAATLLERASGRVDPDLVSSVLLLRAVGELGLIRPTREGDIQRGLALMTAHGRSWEHESADGNAFGLARVTDDLERAIAMTRELIRVKSGPAGDDPFNLVHLSGLLLLRGDWTEARRIAEVALAGYEREGEQVHPAWGLRGVALVAAHDGRVDEARRLAGEGLARATERGDVILAIFHRQILGFVALSLGEWRRADDELREAAALAESIATRHPGRFKFAGDWAEAVLALGDLERAAGIVGWLEETGRVAPTPWVLAVGARCAALLAAARGDLDGAAAALERALAEHERLLMPFERARTLLLQGQLHRR
ncbi:MAG: AAA family ATPase, partial [Candidatus Limnocylindrales bacterium]